MGLPQVRGMQAGANGTAFCFGRGVMPQVDFVRGFAISRIRVLGAEPEWDCNVAASKSCQYAVAPGVLAVIAFIGKSAWSRQGGRSVFAILMAMMTHWLHPDWRQ